MSTSQNKVSPQQNLLKIYKNVKLNKSYIDPYSVNDGLILNIIKAKSYNEIVDWSCVFNTIFEIYDSSCIDGTATKLSLSQAQKCADLAHQFLNSIPVSYHFLLPMPKGMPVEKTKKITSKVSFAKITSAELAKYKSANPSKRDTKPGALSRLLGSMESQRTAFILPSQDETYLKVDCHGYVGGGGSTVYEVDPIYIYKVMFALNFAMGFLERDRTPKNPNFERFAQFAFKAYMNDRKFVTSISRPSDEAELINNFKFKDDIDSSKLTRVIKLTEYLLAPQKVKANEKLRNQIVNSLFWYFETNKTTNPNMKSVFFTSVFDSFFNQEDKSNLKSRMIASECSATAEQYDEAKEEIEELYQSRNSIIHGERPLLDYQIEGKRVNAKENALVQVSMVIYYNKFLTNKLNRYGKSLGIFK